jgi:hypothetical protein
LRGLFGRRLPTFPIRLFRRHRHRSCFHLPTASKLVCFGLLF